MVNRFFYMVHDKLATYCNNCIRTHRVTVAMEQFITQWFFG